MLASRGRDAPPKHLFRLHVIAQKRIFNFQLSIFNFQLVRKKIQVSAFVACHALRDFGIV